MNHGIEVRDVSYTYPDGRPALRNVSFTLTQGRSAGILGANGAGKSTLLLLLTGVLFPTGGEIRFGDTKLTRKTLPDIRRRLGLVFQNPDDQLFMATIYDDIAFGPRNMKLSETEVEARVTAALTAAGIPHLRDRAPYRCSGGEKRAAAIAGILSMDPDILILDEPTSDLDPKARRKLIHLLKSLELSLIIASHDIRMVQELCERTVVLQDGVIKYDGETRLIVTDPVKMDEYGLEAV